MEITDNLVYPATRTDRRQEVALNVETGALVVSMDTSGAISQMTISEPSKLVLPEDTQLTFALNGDTATVTRL